MGMFDSFKLKGQKCANCGAELDEEWQTKSLFNQLRVFETHEEVENAAQWFDNYASFHNYCPECYHCNYIVYNNGKWAKIQISAEDEQHHIKVIRETIKRSEKDFYKREKVINRSISQYQFEIQRHINWRDNYASKFIGPRPKPQTSKDTK